MTAERFELDGPEDPGTDAPRMSVLVFRPTGLATGDLAVVAHGRNGAADAPHVLQIVAPYLTLGMTVVSPNLCCSEWNDSAGRGADFLIGRHVRDTERTIRWAQDRRKALGWRAPDLCLAGHSMGGYAVMHLAATEHRAIARHVLAVSTFTSGENQFQARLRQDPLALEHLAREAPMAIEDWPRHDIRRDLAGLTMPASMIVGDRDTVTPAEHMRAVFEELPDPVDFVVLSGAHHCLEGGPHDAAFLSVVRRLEARAPHSAA